MSTTDRTTLVKAAAGLTAALAVLVTGTLVLAEHGPGDMAKGFAVGGGTVAVLFLVAVVRALRSPERLTHAERALTGHADERDARLTEKAFAAVGVTALPTTAIAAVAIAVGAPAAPVLGSLVWLLVVVLVVTSVVVVRRS